MRKNLYTILFIFFNLQLFAQSIDKIEAIIGDEILLHSEIESQYLQYLAQGDLDASLEVKCDIIEDLLLQRILVNQAKIDSVSVSDEEIENETLNRIKYFEAQLGSIDKVEGYFDKSIEEIKEELKSMIEDQFYATKMNTKITSNLKVTPAEVKELFYALDSLDIPLIPAKVEIAQIVIHPEITQDQKNKIKSKLNTFRNRIEKGEDFKVLAALYSDDEGSASNGGELGFVHRGELVPEFERAAFRLQEGEISEVIESKFGLHIIQLIERRGEQVNVRHILLQVKANAAALVAAKLKSENIVNDINSGKISFLEAVNKYSNDDSKNNGGLLLEPNNMSSMHLLNEMSAALRVLINNLEVGDISSPSIIQIPNQSSAYRILKLNKRIIEHQANLIDDFSIIKEFVESKKKQEALLIWLNKTINSTFIKLNKDILSCSFQNNWIKNNYE